MSDLAAMDLEHYKQLLLAKEKDLQDQIARLGDNARNSQSADVEDPIDQVISAEAKAANFREESIAAETLADVQDALRRIDDGTYGVSIESGEPIPPARLEAVPWAKYTVQEQERLDRLAAEQENQDNPLDNLA
jgi:DnaK suppressor protein